MYNYVNSDAGLYSLKAGGIFLLLNNYILLIHLHSQTGKLRKFSIIEADLYYGNNQSLAFDWWEKNY